MRAQLNDQELEQVVGGVVRVNGNRMQIAFTTLKEVYKLQNCEDSDAMMLVTSLYAQYKNEGDLAFENATKAAFEARGWLKH